MEPLKGLWYAKVKSVDPEEEGNGVEFKIGDIVCFDQFWKNEYDESEAVFDRSWVSDDSGFYRNQLSNIRKCDYSKVFEEL